MEFGCNKSSYGPFLVLHNCHTGRTLASLVVLVVDVLVASGHLSVSHQLTCAAAAVPLPDSFGQSVPGNNATILFTHMACVGSYVAVV